MIRIVLSVLLVCLYEAVPSSVQASDSPLLDAARSANLKSFRQVLKQPGLDVNAPDERGFTPLIYATRYFSTREMERLLRFGANPNYRTKDHVTAFNFAVADLPKARLLLDHGFDCKNFEKGSVTPLHVAARHPRGYAVARLLVEKGADVNARGPLDSTPLYRAIYGASLETVRLLLEHGADPKVIRQFDGGASGEPFLESIYEYNPAITKLFLEQGPGLNISDDFGGHSLPAALMNGQTSIVRDLINGGADLRAAKNVGEVPPILFAAHNERGSRDMVKLLLEKGADLNSHNDRDETVLTWARKRGETDLVRFLVEKGAKDGVPQRKPEIPSHPVSLTKANREALIRDAATRSVAILQKGSAGFLDRATRPEACVSCHHQTFPGIAFGWAAQIGVPVDQKLVERQTKAQLDLWRQRVDRAWACDDPVGGAAVNVAYGLLNLAENHRAADDLTDAMAYYINETQLPSGLWRSFRARPPAESTPIASTALALRSSQLYPVHEKRADRERRAGLAQSFLLRQEAFTTEERSFQILGLAWAGARQMEIKRLASALLKAQRADGGWAQIPTLESDAYATGQVLLALLTGGAITVDDPAYFSGAEFLLRTQFPDGSWFVKSRTWPFQTHFPTGFPHGRDQWISASATTWAALALMTTLDPQGPRAFRPSPSETKRLSLAR